MVEEIQNKETEWDSSLATLIRIDNIIKAMHGYRMGKNWESYFDSVYSLFVEGQTKFNPKEIIENKTYQKKINDSITQPVEFKNVITPLPNLQRLNIIKTVPFVMEYELWLMRVLDSHNMLMRNAKNGIQKFRGM